MQFSLTLRTNRLQAIKDLLGAGGTVEIRTGAAPGVGNAATGTLLATWTALTFGTPTGTMSVSATADGNAAASGTPGYYRGKTAGGTAHLEGPAGVASGEISFNSAISIGGTVTLTSGTVTEGNA